MNPIDFFEQQVERWRTENNFCTEFHAPMVESAINIVQVDSGCVQLFLTDLSINRQTQKSNATGLVNVKYFDYTFNLYVLKQGNLGGNNYDEIRGHAVDCSVWRTHLEPLLKYFGDTEFLDFCRIWNYPIEVTRWQMNTLINYADNNYHGWRIQTNFRVNS